jgi:hypothetical protein
MLTMGHVSRFQSQNEIEYEPGQYPLSTEYIGRYLEMAPKSGIAFIQMFTRGEMGIWNYTPAPVRFAPRERLRYILAFWPVNFVSMRAWRLLESKNFNHHRQPGDKATTKVASRNPGSNPGPVT